MCALWFRAYATFAKSEKPDQPHRDVTITVQLDREHPTRDTQQPDGSAEIESGAERDDENDSGEAGG